MDKGNDIICIGLICFFVMMLFMIIASTIQLDEIRELDVRLDNIQTELEIIGNCATRGNITTHYNHAKKQCVEVE